MKGKMEYSNYSKAQGGGKKAGLIAKVGGQVCHPKCKAPGTFAPTVKGHKTPKVIHPAM